jgi:hypothetical protein
MMRWTVLERVLQAILGGVSFASLLSLHGGRRSRAGFPPTLTWSPRVGGMATLPSLTVPCHGRWNMADMLPLALDACEDISCLLTCSWIFTRCMWLFNGYARPSMGGGVADVCIP